MPGEREREGEGRPVAVSMKVISGTASPQPILISVLFQILLFHYICIISERNYFDGEESGLIS